VDVPRIVAVHVEGVLDAIMNEFQPDQAHRFAAHLRSDRRLQ